MQLYTKEQAIRQMNYLGQSCRPFIFIINYQQDASYIEAVSSVDPAEILYNLNGFTNQPMFAENNISFFVKKATSLAIFPGIFGYISTFV